MSSPHPHPHPHFWPSGWALTFVDGTDPMPRILMSQKHSPLEFWGREMSDCLPTNMRQVQAGV